MFRAVKLIKNADPGKYKCSGYGVEFGARGSFSISDGSGIGKNVIIFGADMSSLVHIGNKKKYIFILGTDALDGTALTSEKEYSINFTEQLKKFCLRLPYNGVNSF